MNRRDFLISLGFGVGAYALDPKALFSVPASLDQRAGYPVPHFTGFERSVESRDMCGQFLWGVLFEVDGKTDMTHWYMNSTITGEDLRRDQSGRITDATVEQVRLKLSRSFAQYVHVIDGIVEKAQRGVVETTESPLSIPNSLYDPSHAATHDPSEFLDEDGDPAPNYCIHCAKTTSENRDVPFKRFKIVNWMNGQWGMGGLEKLWDAPQETFSPINPQALIDQIAALAAETI